MSDLKFPLTKDLASKIINSNKLIKESRIVNQTNYFLEKEDGEFFEIRWPDAGEIIFAGNSYDNVKTYLS